MPGVITGDLLLLTGLLYVDLEFRGRVARFAFSRLAFALPVLAPLHGLLHGLGHFREGDHRVLLFGKVYVGDGFTVQIDDLRMLLTPVNHAIAFYRDGSRDGLTRLF